MSLVKASGLISGAAGVGPSAFRHQSPLGNHGVILAMLTTQHCVSRGLCVSLWLGGSWEWGHCLSIWVHVDSAQLLSPGR